MNPPTPTAEPPRGFVALSGPYNPDVCTDSAMLQSAIASLRAGNIAWRLVVTEHGTQLWRDRAGTLDRNGNEIRPKNGRTP
jgi:hypothetical protein